MQKGIINPSTTQQMLSTYNAALRQYVTDNHFMDTFDFIRFPAVKSSSASAIRHAARQVDLEFWLPTV
jgi:hypothetical protein